MISRLVGYVIVSWRVYFFKDLGRKVPIHSIHHNYTAYDFSEMGFNTPTNYDYSPYSCLTVAGQLFFIKSFDFYGLWRSAVLIDSAQKCGSFVELQTESFYANIASKLRCLPKKGLCQ